MLYKGSKLQEMIQSSRGGYSELSEKMAYYLNVGDKPYRMETLYKDGHNITLKSLTALLRATNKPIDYFVEFEDFERPLPSDGYTPGNGGNTNSQTIQKVEHLNEVIQLKDELLREKERIISMKESEASRWREKYEELLSAVQSHDSDKSRT